MRPVQMAACLAVGLLGTSLITSSASSRTRHETRGHQEEGWASWHGGTSRTATGGHWTPEEMVAAHKTLPFGTKVKVTNKKNFKSVIVTIKDRGPYIKGRIIDVSVRAARELAMYEAGAVPVTLEVAPIIEVTEDGDVTEDPDGVWRRDIVNVRGNWQFRNNVLQPGSPDPTQSGMGGPSTSPQSKVEEYAREPVEREVPSVDDYLCLVYDRMPVKKDSAGDFTWKDKSAAKRKSMGLCEYSINGMHRDLREILYHFGKTADGKGVKWSFLSAFRDDYRQKIATGFKAGPCGSWHGGSCRTRGYGDGRAADVWVGDEDGRPGGPVGPLFSLLDKIGRKLGLSRPMPGNDPAHIQLAGNWQEIARGLREARTGAKDAPVQQVRQLAESPSVRKRHRTRVVRRHTRHDRNEG